MPMQLLSLSRSLVYRGTRRKGLPPRNYFLYKSEAIRFGVIPPYPAPCRHAPLSPAALSRLRRLHAPWSREKWLRFINDTFTAGKFLA